MSWSYRYTADRNARIPTLSPLALSSFLRTGFLGAMALITVDHPMLAKTLRAPGDPQPVECREFVRTQS